MKVVILAAGKVRERRLAKAFAEGAIRAGENVQVLPRSEGVEDCDVAVMVGVKSRRMWNAYERAGARMVMLDKGFLRDSHHFRVSVGAALPTEYLASARHDPARWDRLGIPLAPWRRDGRHILIAGSSAKYHEWFRLPDPTTYYAGVVAEIRARTKRPIVYRPKPSWSDKQPVEGAGYHLGSRQIMEALAKAHCLVTHGSNACFEAVIAGVPSIILGDGVAHPLSSASLDDIEAPRLASDAERRQWLANLAWCQFTLGEFASGLAWRAIREQLC